MGLAEQIKAGGTLSREVSTFTTDVSGIGSVALASAYALLRIQSSNACRIRLYDNQSSRDNAGEIVRVFGNTNVSESVALIGDFSMSAAGAYTIDPVLYGVPQDASTKLTYYRVDPTTPSTNITLTYYLLEDVPAQAGTFYSLDNRRSLPSITKTLASNQRDSGSLSDSTIPQTYILVSASLANTSHVARLRIYSTSASLYNSVEKARSSSVEPSSSAYLIADMTISGSQTTYFSPKIIGVNLQNMGTNLEAIRGNQALISGENKLYYIIDRLDSGATQAVTADLHVFSLED